MANRIIIVQSDDNSNSYKTFQNGVDIPNYFYSNTKRAQLYAKYYQRWIFKMSLFLILVIILINIYAKEFRDGKTAQLHL